MQQTFGSFKPPTRADAPNRIPFMFTSDLRLQATNKPTTTLDTMTQQNGVQVVDNNGADASIWLNTKGDAVNVTTPIIKMAVNPSSIRWEQAKRIVKRDTKEGSVFFHFTNRKLQDNDLVKLSFEGFTGAIGVPNGLAGANSDYAEATRARLMAWHELYALTHEPVAFIDQLTGRTITNNFHIIYRTQLFPSGIRLTGVFDTPMTFSEEADGPFGRKYAFSFMVQHTTPDIDDIKYAVLASTTAVAQRP